MHKKLSYKKNKISFTGCLLMGLGCTIGVGIFGSLPEISKEIGSGIIYALLAAAAVIILRSITRMYAIAALPCNASAYMHACKLIHPAVGILNTINSFLQPTLVALFGTLFATYLEALLPNIGIPRNIIAVMLLAMFTFVAWHGIQTSVRASNIMVGLLLTSIMLYIVPGLGATKSENLTIIQIVAPNVSFSSIAAAAGILTSSLSGAASCAELSDEMTNPHRDIPLVLILCPCIVATLYILMAIVTIGVIPYKELTDLNQVAAQFMSPILLTFFTIGPICGAIASLVPVALSCGATMEFSAKNLTLPKIFCKKNKNGVNWLGLLVTMTSASLICLSGMSFGVLFTIFSVTNAVIEIPSAIIPIFALKKYPRSCTNSYVKIPPIVIKVLSVLTAIVLIYLCIEMALTLPVQILIAIISVYVFGFFYLFVRKRYLAGKGIDLFAVMSAPHQPWDIREKKL